VKPVGHGDIERMAELAGLDVEPESLSSLTREIAAIIEYVSQLGGVQAEDDSHGTEQAALDASVRLRQDEPGDVDAIGNPGAFAPAFEDGFFVVPKPEAMGDA
jgi:aspartyl-tRNA(Asn)/glutamyl-tRNA(Gln) amidotransferase subunit C